MIAEAREAFEYRFAVPRRYAQRAAAAFLGATIMRPGRVVLIVVAVLVSLLAWVAMSVLEGLTGSAPGLLGLSRWQTMSLLVGFVVMLFLLYVLVLPLSYRAVVRQFRAAFPPGTEIATRFGSEYLSTKSPQGESTMRYDAFGKLTVRDDFVILRLRRGTTAVVLPRELFPEQWLSYIQNIVRVVGR